jgi:hypothetical protein
MLGYGEMVNWVTCREPLGLETCRRAQVESLGAERPQGRAIGKTHIDGKFKMFINESLTLKINLPIFHHSIIPCVSQKEYASINHFRFPRFGGIEIPRHFELTTA